MSSHCQSTTQLHESYLFPWGSLSLKRHLTGHKSNSSSLFKPHEGIRKEFLLWKAIKKRQDYWTEAHRPDTSWQMILLIRIMDTHGLARACSFPITCFVWVRNKVTQDCYYKNIKIWITTRQGKHRIRCCKKQSLYRPLPNFLEGFIWQYHIRLQTQSSVIF